MIASLICWALVVLLFALNGEHSDARTGGRFIHHEKN
jgi:hypothetical protein